MRKLILDSCQPKPVSATLFGRSFGQICFGKNVHDSAKTEASVKTPKLLIWPKLQQITRYLTANQGYLAQKYKKNINYVKPFFKLFS